MHNTLKQNGTEILEQKTAAKMALQEELGWPAEPKRAMVCLPAGMSDALGGELLKEMLPGLLELPVEILILGKGSSSYGKFLTDLATKHSHRIAIIPNSDEVVRAMVLASDMALFLTDPSELSELPLCLKSGTLAIGPESRYLQNYNPNQESGNGFTYAQATCWQAYAAIVRALETYRFPFDWKTIQKHCVATAG